MIAYRAIAILGEAGPVCLAIIAAAGVGHLFQGFGFLNQLVVEKYRQGRLDDFVHHFLLGS
jgi:hypothetical protein